MKPLLLQGHERSLTQIKYNREGDLLFSCSKDKTICVWYSDNGERLGTYDGHQVRCYFGDTHKNTPFLLVITTFRVLFGLVMWTGIVPVWPLVVPISLSDYGTSKLVLKHHWLTTKQDWPQLQNQWIFHSVAIWSVCSEILLAISVTEFSFPIWCWNETDSSYQHFRH